jgi:glycosyltransferase involved in cell wall biosynthesis
MEIIFHEGFPPHVKQAFAEAACNARRFVEMTEVNIEEAVRLYGLDPSKTAVIPSAIDTDSMKLKGDIDPASLPPALSAISGLKGSDVLLCAGRMVEGKGVLEALDGFEEYARSGPRRGCYLIIAGGGKKEYIDKVGARIRSMPDEIRSRIITLGFIPHEKMGPLYRLADATIVLSESEALCRSVLESFAAGTPVIASDRA